MERAKSLIQPVAGVLLGTFATLAAFGVTLSIAWAIAGDSQSAKLIAALLSAVLAIFLGGVVVAGFSRSHDLTLPVAFGFLFGGFSFTYIFGIDLLALTLAILSAAASGAGGFVYHRMQRDASPAPGFDAG